MIEIKRLGPDDAQRVRELRLESLKMNPEAFGGDLAENEARPLSVWQERLKLDGNDAIFGAIETDNDRRLVGMTGFYCLTGEKLRHRSRIWGVYVTPDYRGTGTGRALMQCAIDHARTCEGTELIEIAVVTTNEAAFNLYRSLGFTLMGTQPHALKIGDTYYDEAHLIMFL